MLKRNFFLISILMVMANVRAGYAQEPPHWRFWKVTDGLAASNSTKISIAPNGNIVLNHDDIFKLSEFDGFDILTMPVPENDKRIYRTQQDVYWTVFNQGLLNYSGGDWKKYLIDEIQSSKLNNWTPNSHGNQDRILLLFFDRLIEFDPVSERTTPIENAFDSNLMRFNHLTNVHDRKAWITGEQGVAKLSFPNENDPSRHEWEEFLIDEELGVRDLTAPVSGSDGTLFCSALSIKNQKRVLIHFDGQSWQRLHEDDENVIIGWQGVDDGIWVMTEETLLNVRGKTKTVLKKKGILSGQFHDVAIESNGVFWIATSQGLARYAPPTWRTPPPVAHLNQTVHSILEDSKGRLWFDVGDKLVFFYNDRWIEYSMPKGFSTDAFQTESLCELPDGKIATSMLPPTIGLFIFKPDEEEFELRIHSMVVESDRRYVRSIFSRKDNKVWVQCIKSFGDQPDFRIDLFDGKTFQSFLDLENKWNLGEELRTIYQTQNGDLWFGGTGGDSIGVYHENTYRTFGPAAGYPDTGAFCILEVEDGKLWVGGRDKLCAFDGQHWEVLLSGLDSVRSIVKSSDGSIWVTTGIGLYRYKDHAWLLNTEEDGLPNTIVFDVVEDRLGRLWTGTLQGLSLYHPEADPDSPRLDLDPNNLTNIAPDGEAQFAFSGIDKWKYANTERLLFSHRIDDGVWTQFSPSTVVSHSGLQAGNHRFEVCVMDRNNNRSKPKSLQFTVLLPWYKEKGFLAILAISIVLILFLSSYAINRHFRLRLSYETLRRTQDHLIQSEKMASLGQLVAGVAHEINNPINFIKSNIQPLKEYLAGFKNVSAAVIEKKKRMPDEMQQEFNQLLETNEIDFALEDSGKIIQSFEDGSNRIANIIADLRQYIRIGKEYQSSYDIHEAIDSTLSLLQNQYQGRISLHKYYGGIPKITCSPGQINQVFLNILKNAFEFIEDKGNVRITTSRDTNHIIVTIRDDGKGIPPEHLTKVFDPFFTTKPVGSGTGLGLSLSYGIIEQHGGKISVQSEIGIGTTFTLRIPIHKERLAR